jgi:hypothetical protein
MSSTQVFDQLWQEAYYRELPILREAAVMVDGDGSLADDVPRLCVLARSRIASRGQFEAGLRQHNRIAFDRADVRSAMAAFRRADPEAN